MRRRRLPAVLGVLALALLVCSAPGLAQTEEAQDFALFYEALAPYGKWIDYGKYGPVWFPTGVSEDWRPYLDGRWVPTEEGWVFETGEPWGWATYHFGNWFPTIEYGWVWAPGSTWYPSTAVWRASDDYIGWAPLPPPNYEPVPAFYPEGGYYPGAPLWDLLTPPFWMFSPATGFLLGFGQPFASPFSYWNCGCLAPFLWSPFLAFRTFFLPDFFFPSFAPNACFAFGPAFPFISRVASINIVVINKFVKDVHFKNLKNVVPPKPVLDRQPFIRKAVPDPVLQGQRFGITPVKDIKLAESSLLRPRATPLPVGVPRVSQEIPKALALPHRARIGPEALQGVKGMGLPAKAVTRTAPRVTATPSPGPAPPVTPRAPARLETREEAGARLMEIGPPRRAGAPAQGPREIRRAAPPAGIPEQTLRSRQQQELRALEQGQLRQQEAFQEQQRLLEQRQLRQQESLRRQQEQLRLRQQLEERQLRRQEQFRRQPQPPVPRTVPARSQFRIEPGGPSSSLRQIPSGPVQPRSGVRSVPGGSPRSFQAPSRSFSGRGAGGAGRSSGTLGGRGGMGFGGISR